MGLVTAGIIGGVIDIIPPYFPFSCFSELFILFVHSASELEPIKPDFCHQPVQPFLDGNVLQELIANVWQSMQACIPFTFLHVVQ